MAKAKKLPSGNWRVLLYTGKDENGKRLYKSFTAPTKKEAEAQSALYSIQQKETKKQKMTVGQAIDKYIESKENVLSPSTIDSYKRVRHNCLQSIMEIEIQDLQRSDMQIAINMDSARLSPKTVRNAYGLVATAVKMFRPDIVLNVTLPAKQHKVKTLPTVQEIIQAIQGTEIELPCMLAMWLSLRMSEIRGLKYTDIENGILTVRSTIVTVNGEHVVKNQTKTYGSTRQLKVPDYIMNLIEQSKKDSDGEYVVTMTGQAIYKRFTRLLERNGIQHMTFHDLRHINASVMLMLGVPDKYAMERGG